MFLPLFFRQRYDGHRYALDRVHRGRDCRLLLTRKLVHGGPLSKALRGFPKPAR